MKFFGWQLALWLAVFSGMALADEPSPSPKAVDVGDALPELTGLDDQGEAWKSSAQLGKKVLVLYFYPGDFTGGCIRQAEAHREGLAKLEALGAEVVGISGDEVATHKLFKETYGLKHKLLADTKGVLAKQLGVPVSGGGKVRPHNAERKPLVDADGGPITVERAATLARWTFVIGEDGYVIYKNTKVQPAQDSKQILELLETRNRENGAVEALKQHGARIERQTSLPGQPVVAVNFIGCHMRPDDLRWLADLPELERLSLRGASIHSSDLAQVTGLPKLRQLDLDDTKVDDDGVEFFRQMKGLTRLSLAGTRITAGGLARLATLTNLEALNLDFTFEEFSDADLAPLGKLTRLKYLNLGGTLLTDAGLKLLDGLALDELLIEQTRVSEAGLAGLRRSFPNLKLAH